jgi:hypothetical protein
MLKYFGRILGPAYTVVTKEDHLVGRFNKHLGNTLMLHSEEALYGGDVRHAGIIRSLITDEYHMFEAMGIDAVKARNDVRLVLTSNKILAAPVQPGDRRYTIIDMGKRKAPKNLISQVLYELDHGGPAALFHELLTMKYDGELARSNVVNKELLDLKGINLPPLETWWYDTLTSGCVLPDMLNWAQKPEKDDWPQCVSSTALHVAMTLAMRDRNVRSIPNERYLAYQLDRFTGHKLIRSQRNYMNPMMDEAPPLVKRLNSRQSSIVNLPDLADCRRGFEDYLGQEVEWPKDDLPKLPHQEQPHDKF